VTALVRALACLAAADRADDMRARIGLDPEELIPEYLAAATAYALVSVAQSLDALMHWATEPDNHPEGAEDDRTP
jgi:hypothetical protein